MPVDYRIHSDLGLVVAQFQGNVTDEEVLQTYRRVLNDAEYRPEFNDLIDLLDVEGFNLKAGTMRQIIMLADQAHADGPKSFKTAVVASNALPYGLARMYEALADGSAVNVSVFRNVTEAMEWLGIAPRPISELHAGSQS